MGKHNNKHGGNGGDSIEKSIGNALNSGDPIVIVGAIAITAIIVIGRMARNRKS